MYFHVYSSFNPALCKQTPIVHVILHFVLKIFWRPPAAFGFQSYSNKNHQYVSALDHILVVFIDLLDFNTTVRASI